MLIIGRYGLAPDAAFKLVVSQSHNLIHRDLLHAEMSASTSSVDHGSAISGWNACTRRQTCFTWSAFSADNRRSVSDWASSLMPLRSENITASMVVGAANWPRLSCRLASFRLVQAWASAAAPVSGNVVNGSSTMPAATIILTAASITPDQWVPALAASSAHQVRSCAGVLRTVTVGVASLLRASARAWYVSII